MKFMQHYYNNIQSFWIVTKSYEVYATTTTIIYNLSE